LDETVDFQYDVFISYAHADRDWAERVHASLRRSNPNVSIFFDSHSLRGGDNWEAQISTSLENCRSLIVLWSDHAKDSEWVSRESYAFLALAKPKDNPIRRLIVVNLQGTNRALNSFQQIGRPALLQAYAGTTPLTPALWEEIASEVGDGLNPARKPISVPLVVLTMTREEFDGLGSVQHNRLRADLNLDDTFLAARYGAARADWKPYAGSQSVTAFLDTLRNTVNAALRSHRLAWRLPDDSFWSDIQSARQFVRDEFNTSDLSVLIIDPVAIYNGDIFQRLMLFQDSLANDRRVIVTLPPFDIPPLLFRLRDALANRATPYFDDYFQPAVPPTRRLAAQCSWNVADGDDIKRHILVAAGNLGMSRTPDEASAFIRHSQGK
jgi:TIR domain